MVLNSIPKAARIGSSNQEIIEHYKAHFGTSVFEYHEFNKERVLTVFDKIVKAQRNKHPYHDNLSDQEILKHVIYQYQLAFEGLSQLDILLNEKIGYFFQNNHVNAYNNIENLKFCLDDYVARDSRNKAVYTAQEDAQQAPAKMSFYRNAKGSPYTESPYDPSITGAISQNHKHKPSVT